MRVIEAFDVPIRTVALSPDGRYVAAASEEDHLAVYSLVTGERVSKIFSLGRGELTFNPQGTTLIYCVSRSGIYALDPTTQPDATKLGVALLTQPVAGGVAISPDGKILVAPLNGRHGQAKLQRWSAPSWAPLTGFEFWSPFQRLAFSPNGEFIAGISSPLFELRIAVTGGLNGRHRNKFQIATEHCFLSAPAKPSSSVGTVSSMSWKREPGTSSSRSMRLRSLSWMLHSSGQGINWQPFMARPSCESGRPKPGGC